jgi:hypothetical protein
MKYLAVFVLLGIVSLPALSQPFEPVINITYSPQHPTWNDTITFYIEIEDLIRPSHLHSSSVNVNEFHIEGSMCYYQSMWIESGSHHDTVKVLLPEEEEGIYIFKYRYGIYTSNGDSCLWEFPGSVEIADSIEFRVYDWTIVEDEPPFNSVTLFPNPTNEELQLIFPSFKHRKIALTNMVGDIVFSSTFFGPSPIINVSKLASGTYLCSVFEDDRIHSYKFLKL